VGIGVTSFDNRLTPILTSKYEATCHNPITHKRVEENIQTDITQSRRDTILSPRNHYSFLHPEYDRTSAKGETLFENMD